MEVGWGAHSPKEQCRIIKTQLKVDCSTSRICHLIKVLIGEAELMVVEKIKGLGRGATDSIEQRNEHIAERIEEDRQ